MTDHPSKLSGPLPRARLMQIDPYVPGKAKLSGVAAIKLSSNESALGASPAAMAAFRAAGQSLERYPDAGATALRTAIGEVHDVDPDQLIIGSGSDEIITLLIRAYCGPGDQIIQSEHGFSYYHIAAASAEAETVFVPERGLTAQVDALIAAATDKTKILFLANPNNPTGTVLMREDLKALRAGLPPHVLLVLDGAYAEYMDDPAYSDGRDLVDASIEAGENNVVMMRTFSKIYGLGGLRVGWAYGPPKVLDVLGRIRPPFNVGGAALASAAAAMEDQRFVAENRAHNAQERARVMRLLSAFGYEVTPGHGNFLLFGAKADEPSRREELARALLKGLERQGVLIRHAASSRLPGHLRVSIGSVADNDAFLAAVADHVKASSAADQ